MIESNIDKSLPYHTASNHHLFNEQEGNGWGKGAGYVHISTKQDDVKGATINGPGQMFSHVAYVAQALSNEMHPVTPQGCGSLGLELALHAEGTKSGLGCLY